MEQSRDLESESISRRAIDSYSRELRVWLHNENADVALLYEAGLYLYREARTKGMAPEQILIMLHARGVPASSQQGTEEPYHHRYLVAIKLLMRAYFARPYQERSGYRDQLMNTALHHSGRAS